jgi:hypothetical protein
MEGFNPNDAFSNNEVLDPYQMTPSDQQGGETPAPVYDGGLFGVPDGFEVPAQMQETFAEVQGEFAPNQESQTEPEPQQGDQGFSPEQYENAKQQLMEQRERHLAEMERRMAREMELLDQRYNTQPQQQPPAEEETPFDQAVRETVQKTYGPQMEQMRAQNEQLAYQSAVSNMIQSGTTDPNMPDFGQVAAIGVQAMGQQHAQRLIMERGPQEAARLLYAQGAGMMRMQQPRQQSQPQQPQQSQQPQMRPQAPQRLQQFPTLPPVPRMPQAQQPQPQAVLPRGMQMQGRSASNVGPQRSYAEIDQWLASPDISFNEYDRFSREHPEALDSFLKYGTTDPTYAMGRR